MAAKKKNITIKDIAEDLKSTSKNVFSVSLRRINKLPKELIE